MDKPFFICIELFQKVKNKQIYLNNKYMTKLQ